MKGMQKIKRGTGFRGLLEYSVDHDDGHIIGGNMAGTTPREISREFGTARRMRPDIDKPVWHNSLRLPAGEHLSDEKWNEVAKGYMHGMGFLDAHQFALIKHDSREGEHIHIIANRVSLNGDVYLGKNENLKSTKLISDLEQKHGLHVTVGAELDHKTDLPSTKTDKRKPKRGEVEKAVRTLVKPARMAIQDAIDNVMENADCRTLEDLTNRLAEQRITVRPFISDGEIKGLSFTSNDKAGNEVGFSGSQLGEQYKYKNLINRMENKNEQDRRFEAVADTRRIAETDPEPIGNDGRLAGRATANNQKLQKPAGANQKTGKRGGGIKENKNNQPADLTSKINDLTPFDIERKVKEFIMEQDKIEFDMEFIRQQARIATKLTGDFDAFCAHLDKMGIQVEKDREDPDPKTGKLGDVRGISYSHNDRKIGGGKLGDEFKYSAIIAALKSPPPQPSRVKKLTSILTGQPTTPASKTITPQCMDGIGTHRYTSPNQPQPTESGQLFAGLEYQHKDGKYNLYWPRADKPSFVYDPNVCKVNLTHEHRGGGNGRDLKKLFDVAVEKGLDNPTLKIFGSDQFRHDAAQEAARRGLKVDMSDPTVRDAYISQTLQMSEQSLSEDGLMSMQAEDIQADEAEAERRRIEQEEALKNEDGDQDDDKSDRQQHMHA